MERSEFEDINEIFDPMDTPEFNDDDERELEYHHEEDETLREHLHYNFIPPVTIQMVEPCKEAINAIRENEPERMIKVGDFYLPASEIVADLKLDSIIEISEERNIEKELDEMFEKAPDKRKFLMDLLEEVYCDNNNEEIIELTEIIEKQ